MKEMMMMHKHDQALSNGTGAAAGIVAAEAAARVSRVSSLLASTDRDYLLSSSGNQGDCTSAIQKLISTVNVKVSDLDGKIIGLYFSANWYPPCWNFNQLLVGIYNQLKDSSTAASSFEIVYISSDEDSNAFNSYYAHMPWLAIPFSDLETKKALNRKFEIEGIPSLVILQPGDYKDGDEATLRDGVEIIYRYGVQAFPFTKQRLEQLEKEEIEKHENQTLTNLLTNHDRHHLLGHGTVDEVPVTSLIGKTIGLYFSAQWCIPCVNFTPRLVSMYKKIKEQMLAGDGEDFEIVFVSSDRDRTSFEAYFSTMPWLALPFDDPKIKELVKHFDVKCIPCLIILGPDGKTVTRQGRNLINLYKENAYPFTDAKLELLEKKMDEEAKSLPRSVYHSGHRHELNLVSEGNGGGPFICCDCDEQGCGWAYQCLQCGYEVHPKCVTATTGAVSS